MAISLGARTISNVRLIDDEANVRTSYRQPVDELELNAIEVTEHISSIENFISMFDLLHDAAICDFNLKKQAYSAFDGDVLVSHLYKRFVPAVLCTKFANELPDPIRHRRRHIPTVLTPGQLSAEDALINAFSLCVSEFEGKFTPERKPWRTLVRVESCEAAGFDQLRLLIVIPGWNASDGLTLTIPARNNGESQAAIDFIVNEMQRGVLARVYAKVNLGSELKQNVYVDEWALA